MLRGETNSRESVSRAHKGGSGWWTVRMPYQRGAIQIFLPQKNYGRAGIYGDLCYLKA